MSDPGTVVEESKEGLVTLNEEIMQASSKAFTPYTDNTVNMKGARATAGEDLVFPNSDLPAIVQKLGELNHTLGETIDMLNDDDFLDLFQKRETLPSSSFLQLKVIDKAVGQHAL